MTDSNTVHFRILEDIARDLSRELNFPTCLDASISIRNALRDANVSVHRLVQVISVEPLITAKILHLANSVAYNPGGSQVTALSAAINRVGLESVRTISLTVALEQLLHSRHLVSFEDLGRQTWEHSLQVAVNARVLARRLGRVNPDDAMLAGVVHDIGIFYLVYRASEYPEYRDDRSALMDLVIGWHESIGESLLYALGLPEHIIQAVRDHDHIKHVDTPCSLTDILYFANLLAGGSEWLHIEGGAQANAEAEADRARYADLIAEAQDEVRDLRQALAG
jgi:putative nucleotidyltransferase with HDIG domain